MEKPIYNEELVEKLRETVKARMKPMPLSVFIPMCQEAADRIEAQERYIAKLEQQVEHLKGQRDRAEAELRYENNW